MAMPELVDLIAARSTLSDAEILAELAALKPLNDEGDPCWNDQAYWKQEPSIYLALADIAAARRLRPAIALLLDRACYGDPGEIMRGLRHNLETIVNPEWSVLADICLKAALSPRLGTRLWAIAELAILDDPRARPVFEDAITNGPEDIKRLAENGLARLIQKGKAPMR
jgi:uncharacterized membrane-anchored protein